MASTTSFGYSYDEKSLMLDIVCLYETSGLSAKPWAEAGYTVYCYDIINKDRVEKIGKGKMLFLSWDATNSKQNDELVARHKDKVTILLAFPPCTDLAVSGAAHFAKKLLANPKYREEAMNLVYTARDIGEALGVPYAIENPVSVISSQWRKPDFIFNPYDYGGYLPENDVHPLYPEYIKARDAYPKKTCYWLGNNFKVPEKKPVEYEKGYSAQHSKLGGKSAKTKAIRNCSPRGMAKAIYEANKDE